jgi:hypothetical protein
MVESDSREREKGGGRGGEWRRRKRHESSKDMW